MRSWPAGLAVVVAQCAVVACSSSGSTPPANLPAAVRTPVASTPHSSPAPIALPATNPATKPPATTARASSTHASTPRSTPAPTPRSTTAGPAPAPVTRTVTRTSPAANPAPVVAPPAASAPVIVIDPGHSPTTHATDPATGLDVSDYENEPEMHDVYAVALLVRAGLRHDGYRVVLTKHGADDRVSLGERAHIANRVHAALALSIHDQAGSNGGLAFSDANNTVYYQSVGTYRETPDGTKVYFTDRHLAAVSKRYGETFRTMRARAEHHDISLKDNVGYDLGSRGLAAGNIWIVQLLAKVPWIYNEAGGNSPGMSGLDDHDKHLYATGLIRSVERSVPIGG